MNPGPALASAPSRPESCGPLAAGTSAAPWLASVRAETACIRIHGLRKHVNYLESAAAFTKGPGLLCDFAHVLPQILKQSSRDTSALILKLRPRCWRSPARPADPAVAQAGSRAKQAKETLDEDSSEPQTKHDRPRNKSVDERIPKQRNPLVWPAPRPIPAEAAPRPDGHAAPSSRPPPEQPTDLRAPFALRRTARKADGPASATRLGKQDGPADMGREAAEEKKSSTSRRGEEHESEAVLTDVHQSAGRRRGAGGVVLREQGMSGAQPMGQVAAEGQPDEQEAAEVRANEQGAAETQPEEQGRAEAQIIYWVLTPKRSSKNRSSESSGWLSPWEMVQRWYNHLLEAASRFFNCVLQKIVGITMDIASIFERESESPEMSTEYHFVADWITEEKFFSTFHLNCLPAEEEGGRNRRGSTKSSGREDLAGTKEGARGTESMAQDQEQEQVEDSAGKHGRDSTGTHENDLVGKQEHAREKDSAEKF
ncbi:uncharacterized protein LOC125038628 [Penaeus chinensis]|uniref:uncharacterized protein LOC125038628 n=1 Tax=Penaeus chinensis TaxID=139456 RepID=UPI001FB61262|nr:uncharacterized protein LOC125038628 [Penaeus chinensis]